MGAGALTKNDVEESAGRQRWLALAEKALAGASVDEALVSRSEDGIRIEPLYERSAAATAVTRADPGAGWTIVQRVDDPDVARATAQAREDVAQGATGLSLVFEGAANAFGYGLPCDAQTLETILGALPLNQVKIRIDVHPSSRATAEWLVAFLGKRRAGRTPLDLSFGIDPAALFASTGRLRMSIEALQASMPQSLAHFFSLGAPGILLEADGRVFHNAGATEAQELGIMLASAVSYLRLFEDARQPLVYAAPHIGFALSVDQDQLISMAKIRALRKLWARVQEACSIPVASSSIHAESSLRMMTAKDPETNILRTTIACFAAATGGADSISLLPHTAALGLPADHARRIARNIQLIMANESHVDYVADPAAGSGGMEALTLDLCETAWEEFQRIETEGGVLASLQEGRVQGRILQSLAHRNDDYRNGARALVGTTLHPLKSESPVETLPAQRRVVEADGVARCMPLPPVRIDQSIGGGQ